LQNADCGFDVTETVTPEQMKRRTQRFALRAICLAEALPKGRTAEVVARQLVRSGTSVGANYRAACRAKSPADFVSKMHIVEEEVDESVYWMELLVEAKLMGKDRLEPLMREADELLAIAVASINTARRKGKRR